MIELGYYVLTLIMIVLFPILIKRSSINAKNKTEIIKMYLIFIPVWLTYVIILSESGILNSLDLPPRMPLLVILPILIFIFTFTNRPSFKKFIELSDKHSIVFIQSFRVFVELLIFGTFLLGILPKRVTFEGWNFDILVGLSALLFGYITVKGKAGNQVLLGWNMVSLFILSITIFSFISSFFIDKIVSDNQLSRFLEMPFILLPAVLLPFAIFYHVISIKQVMNKNN